jgi:hypothetical protein
MLISTNLDSVLLGFQNYPDDIIFEILQPKRSQIFNEYVSSVPHSFPAGKNSGMFHFARVFPGADSAYAQTKEYIFYFR